MANFNPTKAQQQAINDRGTNILVSASAGSGKTAVLVNRTIKLIQEGHRIDRMLLVTFTEAAAKNMRDKIRQALEAIVQDSSRPKDLRDRMREQITLLVAADISTIHAFCLKLIKRYYYLINLNPQFRLLTDETERVLLQEDVWHELSERYYQAPDQQEAGMASFGELVLNFSSDRDDTGLDELVLRLAELATAQPDPEAWLNSLAANYDLTCDLLAAPFYQQVQELVSSRLKQLEQDYAELIARATNDGLDKMAGVLKDDQDRLQRLAQVLADGSSWDAIRGEFNTVKFKRMSGKPKDDPVGLATYTDINDIRKEIKNRLAKLTARYFEYDEQQLRQLSAQAQAILRKLSAVTIEFRHQYQQAKLNRHVLEFSDLEHYAHQILTPPADNPDWQKLVTGLREHYQDIMIDEYQDTNRLQESILMKLTTAQRQNLFMVGDVKQSIYRFREADPSLFIGKYDRYLASDGGEAIVLAENFRSMTNITGLTNLIFEQLMDHELGEIDYDQPAHLKYAAKYYEDNAANHPQPTEIMLYDANGDEASADPANHEDDKLAGELRMVALRIKQLVAEGEQIFDPESKQMRPIKYGDIVLLERTKTINNTLMDEFNRAGVPLTVHDVESYFQATEVRVMMALLKIIDNPMQDIPLVAVLRSPIVGLDNQELAFIRLQNRSANYYDAVQSFINNYHEHKLQRQSLLPVTKIEQLATKVARFLDQLSSFRQVAQQQSLVDLIWQIYNTTGYLDYAGAMPGGQQRQANLHALYQRAFSYEQSSFKGLYQFIRFIEKMQEHEKDLGIAPTQLSNDTVNVMTIHGSKGLQFPIVFLIDATHGFNQGVSQANAVVDATAGIGIKYLNQQRVLYDTPQRQIALAKVQQSDRAEDMRVLYVALTRAEQRLIITGSFNEDPQASRRQHLASAWQRWQKAYQSNELVLGTQARINANSFMDWIGLALARYPQFSPEAVGTKQVQLATSSLAAGNPLTLPTKPNFTVKTYTRTDLETETKALAEEQSANVQSGAIDFGQKNKQSAVANILGYQYPHQTATQTTAYQSVTDVKRVFEDPDEQHLGKWDYDQQRKAKKQGIYLNQDFAIPKFIRQEDSQPTPAAVGTATHLVFQQLPLQAGHEITLAEVEAEIDRLVDAGLISPIVANQINQAGIVGFYQTAVGKEILEAPQNYHREVPFSMLMNGHELFKGVKADDNEQILIHGIIDGYFETDRGIILVDYKTDHLNPDYRELELTRIIDRYRGQLRLYQEALNLMERVPVVQTGLYLVELKEFISLQEGD